MLIGALCQCLGDVGETNTVGDCVGGWVAGWLGVGVWWG